MLSVIAIDPGDFHVGLARWEETTGIVRAQELDAPLAVQHVHDMLEARTHPPVRRILVLEKFVLYPGQSQAQHWSPMLTSQMIGALKYVAFLTDTEVVEQGADIKNPTRRQLRARGIKSTAVASVHASDAELHLLHYLLKEELWTN